MLGDFIYSEKWLSLVFEGKNKEYGAYVQREESSDRHLKALIIITVIALVLISLQKVMNMVLPAPANNSIGQTALVEPSILETKNITETPVVKVETPALPKIRASVKFTPPVISKNDEINSDELMKTQKDLTESNAVISNTTVITGTDEGIVVADARDIIGGDGLGQATVQDKPRIFAEQMPQFPGGEAALMKWLQANIVYPPNAAEQRIQGRVVLRFVVKSDGSIDQIEVSKGLDPSCDKEALRVMKKMQKWIPGKQNGNPVAVYFSLPVYFKLQDY